MDIQRLKDILSKDTSFAIVVGSSYTVDEMASALSFQLALSGTGKNVSVLSSKEPLVEVSNLVGIDRVKNSFQSQNGDLIVSFPYRNDEIGKVSYTLESGFLNIIVKPKGELLSFGEKDVIFRKSGDIPGVLITIGVKRLSDLSTLFDIENLKDTIIINIDKPVNNEGYGEVVILGQGSSSVSEQVANLLLTLGMHIDQDIAQNLISGIIFSTGNFQSPKTSSLAFEMAGILLRNGARRDLGRAQVQNQVKTPQQFGYNMTSKNTQAQMSQIPSMQQAPRQQSTRPQISRSQRSLGQIQSSLSQMSNSDQSLQVNASFKEKKLDDQPVDNNDAPPDWLAPKIFKGSTNVE